MRKHFILTLALLSIAALSSYAQKTTTMEYNRERVYTTETKVKKVWYQGELTLGVAYSSKLNIKIDEDEVGTWKGKFNNLQPTLTTIHGVRITQWAFVGVGVSAIKGFSIKNEDWENDNTVSDTVSPSEVSTRGTVSYDSEDNDFYYGRNCIYNGGDNWLLPVFANVKGYYPVTDRFAVFVTLSFGKSFMLSNNYWNSYDTSCKLKSGYYGEYGVGLNYRKFNFSLGMQQQQMQVAGDADSSINAKFGYNSFFVKLGLKW